jgi:hypothetical protein
VATLNNDLLQLEYFQIEQDLVELLDTAGQEYTEAQVQAWAWKLLFDRHPGFMLDEAWNG